MVFFFTGIMCSGERGAVVGWVEQGWVWWEGGGGKTRGNEVATKTMCLVSFQNVPGGRVYEV